MDNSQGEKYQDGGFSEEYKNSKVHQRFYLFHPYLTYSDCNSDRFVKPNGEQSKTLTVNTEALYVLGEKAFSRLPEVPAAADFDEGYASYFLFMNELREGLGKSYSEGIFKVRNSKGAYYQPDFSNADNGWILDVAWNHFAKPLNGNDSEICDTYREAFLFHVFFEIDNALVEIDLGGCAAAASISAADALANALSIEYGSENLQKARREIAMQGAIAKHARTYEKRQQVIDYWRMHIPPETSNEKAGEWLHDSFPELSVRKLSEYVAQAKREAKKIPPASKA